LTDQYPVSPSSGFFEKQRAMQEPSDMPASGLADDGLQPFVLGRLLGLAAAEEHRVEPDQPPILGVLDPAVRAEMGAPATQALRVDRLMPLAGIADIVIAGDGAKRCSQLPHQSGGMAEVLLDPGAVDRHVAGMDDEVGSLLCNPPRQQRPVVEEMRFARAQMRVRGLNYPHHLSQRKAASSGIPVKTREHPAARSRSA
jgi:hypothetical protein